LGHLAPIDSIFNRPELSSTNFRFILKYTFKSKCIAKANKQNVKAAPDHVHTDLHYSSTNFAHIILRCG
jgi:hypothetical protein